MFLMRTLSYLCDILQQGDWGSEEVTGIIFDHIINSAGAQTLQCPSHCITVLKVRREYQCRYKTVMCVDKSATWKANLEIRSKVQLPMSTQDFLR